MQVTERPFLQTYLLGADKVSHILIVCSPRALENHQHNLGLSGPDTPVPDVRDFADPQGPVKCWPVSYRTGTGKQFHLHILGTELQARVHALNLRMDALHPAVPFVVPPVE